MVLVDTVENCFGSGDWDSEMCGYDESGTTIVVVVTVVVLVTVRRVVVVMALVIMMGVVVATVVVVATIVTAYSEWVFVMQIETTTSLRDNDGN